MHLLVQSAIDGLMFGSIYAIAGLAFGLVYRLSRVFHIAFGSIGTLGAFVAVAVAGDDGGAGLAVGIVLGALAGAAVTLLIRWAVYGPMLRGGADQGATFVASLGLALLIQALVVLAFGADNRSFAVDDFVRRHALGGYSVSGLTIAAVLAGAACVTGLGVLLHRTRWGHQTRALASNPEQAQLVGIRTVPVTAAVWALAGLLSVVAFVLFGMTSNVVATSGMQLTLFAALAVIAGGVGSLGGTYATGLLIGVLDAVTASKLPGQWSTTAVFLAFILLLLVRPQGLRPTWEAAR